MHAFRDALGRSWELTIHVAGVKRVRALVGVDLYKLAEDGFRGLDELLRDPPRFVDVLYCLCQEQAARQAPPVDDYGFGSGLGGDALYQAGQAFVDELCDFFPNPQIRENLRKVVQRARQVETAVAARLARATDEQLERAVAKVEAVVAAKVARQAAELETSLESSIG